MGGEEPGRERNKSSAARSAAEEARIQQSRMRLIGLSLQLTGTIFGSLIIFGWGGLWLDQRFGTKPLFVLLGVVLAFVAIGYNLYELATIEYKPRAPGSAQGPQQPVRRPPAQGWDDEDEDDWPVQRRTDGKGKGG